VGASPELVTNVEAALARRVRLPAAVGGQWIVSARRRRRADQAIWRAKILRRRPQRLPHMPKSACWMGACSCGHSHSYSRSVRSLKELRCRGWAGRVPRRLGSGRHWAWVSTGGCC